MIVIVVSVFHLESVLQQSYDIGIIFYLHFIDKGRTPDLKTPGDNETLPIHKELGVNEPPGHKSRCA